MAESNFRRAESVVALYSTPTTISDFVRVTRSAAAKRCLDRSFQPPRPPLPLILMSLYERRGEAEAEGERDNV